LPAWRTQTSSASSRTASGGTLGHYGVGYGPYVQLPFYGSFTVREDGGDMVDTLYPVLSWLTWPLFDW